MSEEEDNYIEIEEDEEGGDKEVNYDEINI